MITAQTVTVGIPLTAPDSSSRLNYSSLLFMNALYGNQAASY